MFGLWSWTMQGGGSDYLAKQNKTFEDVPLKNQIISLALIAGLSACGGGNPFDDATATDADTGDAVDGGITGDGTPTDTSSPNILPGTVDTDADLPIFRTEERSESGSTLGNGYADSVSYNSADDTFTVNNLAFDGDANTPYHREEDNLVRSLNPEIAGGDGRFAVYEAPVLTNDPVNGDAIRQFTYRAVYGVSRKRLDAVGDAEPAATTQFAIVRTGNYISYGFGGFVYQRDNGVNLPEQLQATYIGASAGLRDFNGAGGLQYTTADVEIAIDYDDFDAGAGAGVRGYISNRQVLDLEGNNVTAAVAATISTGLQTIPVGIFTVGPNVLTADSDMTGDITSQYENADGQSVSWETSNYYAIVSGDNADEIVGVFVLEGTTNAPDGSAEGISGRDTSGFIVYRVDGT